MKKCILLLMTVLVSVCLASCLHSAETANPIDGIVLGMTPGEFLQAAEVGNLALHMPDYKTELIPEDAENSARDGRIYNYTDYSFYYTAAEYEVRFVFTPEALLREISVWDPSVSTGEGLFVGDSIEKMERLYGTDHRKDTEDVPVYQYCMGQTYLNVFYKDGMVVGWNRSIYPNINND